MQWNIVLGISFLGIYFSSSKGMLLNCRNPIQVVDGFFSESMIYENIHLQVSLVTDYNGTLVREGIESVFAMVASKTRVTDTTKGKIAVYDKEREKESGKRRKRLFKYQVDSWSIWHRQITC